VASEQLDAGGFHVCVVRTDDSKAECWGRDNDGQCSGAPTETQFWKVSAGGYHSCGLVARDDGAACDDTTVDAPGCTVECWGANQGNQATLPAEYAAIGFKDLDLGSYHSCAVNMDGEPLCWSTISITTKVQTRPIAYQYVEAPVVCDIDPRYTPETCLDAQAVVDYTGQGHVDALGAEIGIVCCRYQKNLEKTGFGALKYGAGTTVTHYAKFKQVSYGSQSACGLTMAVDSIAEYEEAPAVYKSDDNLVCWGNDDYKAHIVPDNLAGAKYQKVSAGSHHHCALTKDDFLTVCWGFDYDDQLDVPTEYQRSFIDIAAGWYHGCGVLVDNGQESAAEVVCWGKDQEKQSTGHTF